jgi:hypothetical protein
MGHAQGEDAARSHGAGRHRASSGDGVLAPMPFWARMVMGAASWGGVSEPDQIRQAETVENEHKSRAITGNISINLTKVVLMILQANLS